MVADVGVRPHGQIHAPHEYRAVLLLKALIEAEIVPDAPSNPHQAVFLVGHGGLALVGQSLDLLIQAFGLVGGP